MSTIGIEGVYHVYIKWSPTNDVVSNTAIGRTQLTFRNRQTADEFYRFLATATESTGKNQVFSSLVRNGPQFWYFDVTPFAGVSKCSLFLCTHGMKQLPFLIDFGADIEPRLGTPSLYSSMEPFMGKRVILTLLNDWNGRVFDIFPKEATTEWTNGGAYFIKNTNKQSEFWYNNGDGHVSISDTDRTKFVVRAVAFASDDPQVLIRSDKVTIELAAAASSQTPQYVSLANGSGHLVYSSIPYHWTFNDFFVSLGIERYTNSNSFYERVVDYSPGTSVVWDLV